jgi:hypothetical protein
MAAAGAAQQVAASAASAPGRYERVLQVPLLGNAQQACTVLDGSAAAYASRGPQQMTLWADNRPVPFTLTVNSPQESGAATAAILNFRTGNGKASFDLQMPARPYSSVVLQFASHDVVVRARVSTPAGQELGQFLLFDRTLHGGAADTTLRLGERQDTMLHIALEPGGPDEEISRSQILGALVPPSRAEETLFTTVASATPQPQEDRTVAQFEVPRGVPVERILLRVSGTQDFRRRVIITAQAVAAGALPDQVEGSIQRANMGYNGTHLHTDDQSVDAVLPDNQRSPMHVAVTVENGGLPPLPVDKVDLQMRQRQICFAAWPGVEHWRLFYGAPGISIVTLGSPVRPARSLVQRQNPVMATLGPELLAANFHPLAEPDQRHPQMLFAATMSFLALLALLVILFLRSARIPHIRR